MAIPCDGNLECRDGRDENCEEDKLILVIITAVLFLMTIFIYIYLVFVKIPLWKNSVFKDFDAQIIDSESRTFDCSNMKGINLAKLKVFIPIFSMSSQDICKSSFRIMHRKNNVLRQWL